MTSGNAAGIITAMDIDSLVAIDVHTHVHRSVSAPPVKPAESTVVVGGRSRSARGNPSWRYGRVSAGFVRWNSLALEECEFVVVRVTR